MSRPVLKIAVSVLATLLLALALVPGVIGRNLNEAAVTDVLQLLPAELRPQVQLDAVSINSGWFTSTAHVELTYTAFGALPVPVQLEAAIQHGPFVRTPAGLAFALVYARISPHVESTELDQLLDELQLTLPELHLDLLAGWRGNARISAQLGPVHYADVDGEMDFAGLDAQFDVFADLSAQFSLTMGELSATETATATSLTISELQMQWVSARINDLLAPASAHFSVPEFRTDSPLPLRITDVEIDSRLQPSTAGPEQTDIFLRYAIGSVEGDVPVSSLTWALELNEIRNDLFRRYYELLAELQAEMTQTGGAVNNQVGTSTQELVLMLLQNRLVLNTSLSGAMYGGDHTLDLRVLWKGLPNLTDIGRLDINAALAALEVQLNASLDVEAVARSPLAGMVDPYVQQGFLVLDNGRLTIDMAVTGTDVQLNGTSTTIFELF